MTTAGADSIGKMGTGGRVGSERNFEELLGQLVHEGLRQIGSAHDHTRNPQRLRRAGDRLVGARRDRDEPKNGYASWSPSATGPAMEISRATADASAYFTVHMYFVPEDTYLTWETEPQTINAPR